MEKTYDIFISYASQAEKVAEEVYEKLTARGLLCFMAKRDIPMGEWAAEIREAVTHCERFLLIVTHSVVYLPPRPVRSHHWVFIELGASWFQQKRIIPAIRDSHILIDDLPSPLDRYNARYIRNSTEVDTLVDELAVYSAKAISLRVLLKHIKDDLSAREQELQDDGPVGHKWFINEVSRCNVGRHYYIRRTVQVEGEKKKEQEKKTLGDFVKQWLQREAGAPPYVFLVGRSGTGKTNALIAEVIALTARSGVGAREDDLSLQRAVVFLPLGFYDPSRSFWDNVEALVNSRIHPSENQITEYTFAELLRKGKILLILDGLDEYIRLQGEDWFSALQSALQENVNIEQSRVIFSCRSHVYDALKKKDLFKEPRSKKIEVLDLTNEEIENAVRRRLGKSSQAYKLLRKRKLHHFVRKPLLLEMMCELSEEAWEKLKDESRAADLYTLWFDEIIEKNKSKEADLIELTVEAIHTRILEISITMLENRSDRLDQSKFQEVGLLPEEIDPGKQKLLGIFLKQTETEWIFVHDSFREFSLAGKLVDEWQSGAYDFLMRTSSFDYIGAETYEFVHQLLPDDYARPILDTLDAVMSSDFTYEGKDKDKKAERRNKRNNIVRNSFEAAGMMAQDKKKILKPFIEKALAFLCPEDEIPWLTNKTKYNIVRCLERLHRSAPHPYYEHVFERGWRQYAPEKRFGAWAVRGFRLKKPKVKSLPEMVFGAPINETEPEMVVKDLINKSDAPFQEDVSKCLLALLETPVDESADEDKDRDARFLIINASFALIRWLHEDHLGRLKKILKSRKLDEGAKGNLFQAVYRFGKPALFEKKFPGIFDGMKLRRVSEKVADAAQAYKNLDIEGGKRRD